MLSVFSAPGRYVQGADATQSLGAELKHLGFDGPALIVASNSAQRLLSPTWKATLGQSSISYMIHSFGGECSAEEILKIQNSAASASCSVIIGAGGGKVIDAARAAAAALNIAFVSTPTLASSDAPCSALSVVYNLDGSFSEYRIHRRNPDLVLVDTSIIAQAPERLIVAGMGDALATWFEARTCAAGKVKNMRGGASTHSALALAELCYKTLLTDGIPAIQSLRQKKPNDSLERLVEANTLLSGLGFESSGLAAAHAIHNGLTVIPQTHEYYHGEKVAFGVITQLVLEGAPKHEMTEVLQFARSVGLPTNLRGLGIINPTAQDLLAIGTRTCAPGETIYNEPFAVEPTMIADALAMADAIGSA